MTAKKQIAGITGIVVLSLAAVLLHPAGIQAKEQVRSASQGTPITVEIPATHTAQLTVMGKGTIRADGKNYSKTQEIEISRLKGIEYDFLPAGGYRLDNVVYDGMNVTAQILDNRYMAAPVHKDGTTISVTFKKTMDGGGGKKTDSGSNMTTTAKGTKTGDTSNFAGWLMAVLLSLGLCAILRTGKRKVK